MLRFWLLIIFLFSLFGFSAQTDVEVIKHSKRAGLIKRYRVVKLTKYLTEGLSEEQKVLAIYTWITHNIKYDVKQFSDWNYQEQSVRKTLRRRKGVCSHYASLFHKMCELAEVESAVVVGYSAAELWEDYDPGSYHAADHAWNAVKIDGSWYLLDATFDAGYVEKKKRRPRKLLKQVFGIPYIMNKYRFVFQPTREYYKPDPDQMVITHLPTSPMWQLKSDTIGVETFRKKRWEREHIVKNTFEGNYQYNDSIRNYKFEQHKLKWEGKSGNHFNDTNYRCLSFGEYNYVIDRVNQLGSLAPKEIEDLEERIEKWDTLFYSIDQTKKYIAGAKQVEKKVHKDVNNVHRSRNKQVNKENRRIGNYVRSKIDFSNTYSKSLKLENKRLDDKLILLGEKIEKLGEWEPKTNGNLELKEKRIAQLEQGIKTKLALASALYDEESKIMNKYQFLHDTVMGDIMESVVDSISNMASGTNLNQLIVTKYDHNLDSTYFANRTIVNRQFLDLKVLTDSLFKKFIKEEKMLLTQLKKNTSQLASYKKEIASMVKELSSARSVDEQATKLKELNQIIIRNNSSISKLYGLQYARNDVMMGWLEGYAKQLAQLNKFLNYETGTENVRLKFDLRKEQKRYKTYMNELEEIKRGSSGAKSTIKRNISSLKKEIKKREEEEE